MSYELIASYEKWKEDTLRKKAEWDALPEEEQVRILAAEKQARIEMLARETQRVEKERAERAAEREHEVRIREWQDRGVTPRYFDATWENWIAQTPEQHKALASVKQAWEKNLLVVGGNGTGKTHLAMCLAKDGAEYCLLPELFRAVRDDMRLEQAYINKYGTCKLLVLDEAGRQKATEFERNLLFEIIDKRWNNLLMTTIIGNIDQKEFGDLYGTAITDRLRPTVIKMSWASKRGVVS